jgi:hypothetical protein
MKGFKDLCSEKNIFSVNVWVQFDLCWFAYEQVHAPVFSSKDSGVIEQYPVAEVNVVFCH